jgi:hypothetical protein
VRTVFVVIAISLATETQATNLAEEDKISELFKIASPIARGGK